MCKQYYARDPFGLLFVFCVCINGGEIETKQKNEFAMNTAKDVCVRIILLINNRTNQPSRSPHLYLVTHRARPIRPFRLCKEGHRDREVDGCPLADSKHCCSSSAGVDGVTNSWSLI